MSLRGTVRAVPTMLRIGLAEAVAYRAEMVVWLLSTTMPFVSLLLWSAVASTGAVVGASGRAWTQDSFVSYFLAAFVVRQLVSSWAAWEINYEVRTGVLSSRLLKPIHPLMGFGAGHLAAIPLRALVALPVVVMLLVTSLGHGFPSTPLTLTVWVVSLLGAWLIAFFSNVLIGSLSLFFEQSTKVMEIWQTCFFVFSGYLFPLELFPAWMRAVVSFLPFRFQMGLPVELAVGAHAPEEALPLLAQQWGWVVGLGVVALWGWQRGVKRFQAFGG